VLYSGFGAVPVTSLLYRESLVTGVPLQISYPESGGAERLVEFGRILDTAVCDGSNIAQQFFHAGNQQLIRTNEKYVHAVRGPLGPGVAAHLHGDPQWIQVLKATPYFGGCAWIKKLIKKPG
jgi:hypothetical protein